MSIFSDAGLGADEQAELLDLRTQFIQESGGQAPITDQQLVQIGKAGGFSLQSFSEYAWKNGMISESLKQSMPWLGLGLATDPTSAKSAYTKLVSSYSDAWQSLTGKPMNPVYGSGNAQDSQDFDEIFDAASKNMSPQTFMEQFQNNPDFQKKYPWTAQGMTYDQFKIFAQTNPRQLTDTYQSITGQKPTDAQLKGWIDTFTNPQQLKEELMNDEDFKKANPWLLHGYSTKAQYDQYRLETGQQMGIDYQKVTGQAAPADLINSRLDKFETPQQFLDFLHSDSATMNTYGWLKLGMDFTQFQQQKIGLNQQFGRNLSNEEALGQMMNAHANAGGTTATSGDVSPKGTTKVTMGDVR